MVTELTKFSRQNHLEKEGFSYKFIRLPKGIKGFDRPKPSLPLRH